MLVFLRWQPNPPCRGSIFSNPKGWFLGLKQLDISDWQRSGLTKVTLIQKYQNCNLIAQTMVEPCWTHHDTAGFRWLSRWIRWVPYFAGEYVKSHFSVWMIRKTTNQSLVPLPRTYRAILNPSLSTNVATIHVLTRIASCQCHHQSR